MSVLALFWFVFLAALWGASFLFMRLAVPVFGAMPMAALRVGLAAIALGLLVALLKRQIPKQTLLLKTLGVGVINSGIPFALYAYATQFLPAGYGAVMNATMPFWGVLVGYAVYKESVAAYKVAAIFFAIIGLMIMLSLGSLPVTAQALLAAAACLGATFCYGIAIHYTKRHLVGVDPLVQALGSMIGATLLLAPFGWLNWTDKVISGNAWAALLALAFGSTAMAYVIYFWLIGKVGVLKTSAVTLLIPVFGIFWGVVFLGETLTLGSFVGAFMVVLGTACVMGFLDKYFKRNAT